MPRYFLLAVFVFMTSSAFADPPADWKMAERIDELLAQAQQKQNLQPAPRSSDSEFLRRLHLDLAGATPTAARARAFLADEASDKRRKAIERLLASPTYASRMAGVWRNLLLPNGFEADQLQNAIGLQRWLQDQFRKNLRYDRLVADFLVSGGGRQIGPALFYTSQDLQPEKLAASTSRIFLGMQMECAQCHDHPFDQWTQQDFWGYAAFFAQLDQTSQNLAGAQRVFLRDLEQGEVRLPETETVISPKYPTTDRDPAKNGGTRRMQLAIWMTSRDNPYLAKAAVNRAWAQMFGRGLVEPVDDLRPQNPPSHPELFEELSLHFVRSGFDMKALYRTLANTKAYQASSRQAETAPPESFATMQLKPLTAEQFYDSASRLLKRAPATMQNDPGFLGRRLAFLTKMPSPSGDVSEYQSGVLQALTLLNGAELAEASDPQRGGFLQALEAPFLTNQQRLETLFLATVTRTPTEKEQQLFLAHLEKEASPQWRRRAIGDVLWALLNSAEFAMNH